MIWIFKSNVRKQIVIQALTSLLAKLENNPLVVHKFVVARPEELPQLIKQLTNADDVQINLNNDIECHCFDSFQFTSVDKISISKNETLNFKYSQKLTRFLTITVFQLS